MLDVNKPLTLGASDIDPRGVADGGDDLATLARHSKGLTRVAANRFWEDRLRGAFNASSEQLAQLASFISKEHKHVACVRATHEQASGQPSTHDHTKDTWHMVVTVFVFSMQLKELVSDMMDDIIGEPHHEAYFERTSADGRQRPGDSAGQTRSEPAEERRGVQLGTDGEVPS